MIVRSVILYAVDGLYTVPFRSTWAAMRYPLNYIELSKALCGHILDHDDTIPQQKLFDSYQVTTNRWKMTYKSDYGQNIDHDHLRQSHYMSSCAMIHKQKEQRKQSSSRSHDSSCGGLWGSLSVDVDGSSCGGGCGGD